MHELACPSCNTSSLFNISDYLIMCPLCNATFHLDAGTGKKTIFGDHYIIPNRLDSGATKDVTVEWLKRLHHQPGRVEAENFIVDVRGVSVPLWITSVEAHTAWKGLVRKHNKTGMVTSRDFLSEEGQFRRSYRWAVNARTNICELWGMARMHQPAEDVTVDWDGFPFDSTMTRGKIHETPIREDGELVKEGLEGRHFFEFKLANGLPILGVQVSEQEAMRRAKDHVLRYHFAIAKQYTDYPIDSKTELEVVGVQLVHVPMWQVHYVHRPRSFYRHFYEPKEKKVLIDGSGKSILMGELAFNHYDKMQVNSAVCFFAAVLMFVLGTFWHPAFYLVSLFTLIVAGTSYYLHLTSKEKNKNKQIQDLFINKESPYKPIDLYDQEPVEGTAS